MKTGSKSLLISLLIFLGIFAAGAENDEKTANTKKWEKLKSVDYLAKKLRVLIMAPAYNRRAGGVWVDPRSGDVYVSIATKPIYKSTDHGETWKQWGPDWLTGKLNNPTGLSIHHPYQGRLLFFGKHGTSGLTLDDGKTWLQLPKNLVSGDTDWESDVPSVIITAGDHTKTNMSIDGGKTWHKNGAVGGKSIGFPHMGLIDSKTMLVATGRQPLVLVETWIPGKSGTRLGYSVRTASSAETDPREHFTFKKGIYTTTNLLGPWDYSKDFTQVSGKTPIAPNPIHWKGGRMYWGAVEGLLVSDNGTKWRVHSDGVKNVKWVMFGTTEKDILVLDESKIAYLTSDGGKNWRQAAPKFEVYQPWDATTFGWDPINRYIYASPANFAVYRYQYEAVSE